MTISPLEFFSHLKWIDDRPLLDVIEPYRQRIFMEALYTFGEGTPHYNLALTGRGKKNWKSGDLILAALYRFLAWESPQGNDCFLLANDEGQAGDDLKLAKKLIAAKDAVVEGRKVLRPVEGVEYSGFVDMSGGSSDDAALGIAHFDAARNRAVLDLIATQTGKPPFNPRDAVRKFAGILKEYRISAVTGDRYAGETFQQDFLDHGIVYRVAQFTKSQIYEALEPRINAGEVELLDVSRLTEQLLGLVDTRDPIFIII